MTGSSPRLSGLSHLNVLHVIATLHPFSDVFHLLLERAARKGDPAGSDFAIHLLADIFGEADALLSMTTHQRWVAAGGGGEAIIDQNDPLANARRQEMNGGL